MSNNRLSVRKSMPRQRRTTVLSGKELDNILDDESFKDEDPFAEVKNEASLPYEEVKEVDEP